MRLKRYGLVLAMAAFAGCAAPGHQPHVGTADAKIGLTPSLSATVADIMTVGVVAGAIHIIYDPLAPNWTVEERRVKEDTYVLAMTMKRYHTGGAGESLQIVKRRADALKTAQGYDGYQILEYSEGVESKTLGSQRVARSVLRLVGRQQADSFQLNPGY